MVEFQVVESFIETIENSPKIKRSRKIKRNKKITMREKNENIISLNGNTCNVY